MQGISSTDTHLVDAAAAAKRFDQLLQRFHGNAEMAHMAMQSESHGMVPFAQLAMEYQRLKKAQPTKPVDQNSIRNQILSQGIPTLPQNVVGNEDVYHAARGGIVAFGGPTGSEVHADNSWTPQLASELANYEALAARANPRPMTLGEPGGIATPYVPTDVREAWTSAAPRYRELIALRQRSQEQAAAQQKAAASNAILSQYHLPTPAPQVKPNAAPINPAAPAVIAAPHAAAPAAAAPRAAAPAVIAGPNGPAAAPSPAAVPRTGILSPANPSAGSNDDPIQKLLLDQVNNYHPKTLTERMAEQKAAMGTNQGLEDYKKSIDDLGQISKDNAATKTRFAKAAAFFNMAVAAGKPGQAGNDLSKFINAANEGGLSYAAAMPHIQQGIMDMQQKIAEDKFRVADAQRREDAEGLRDASREYNADERGHMQLIGELARFRASEYGANKRAEASEYGADQRAQMQYRLSIRQMNAATATENAAYIRSTFASLDSRRKELNLLRSNIIYTSDPVVKEQLEREYNEVISNLNTLIVAGTQHLGIEGMNKLTGTAPAASTAPSGGWGTAKVVGGGT